MAKFDEQVSLTARRKRTIYENGNFAIVNFSCNGRKFRDQLPPPKGMLQEFGSTSVFVARGNIPSGFEGTIYDLTGEWKFDSKRSEAVLEIKTANVSIPVKEKDITAFLHNCKGIGKKKAKAIAETFGEKCIEICVNDPEQLQNVPGVTRENALDLKHHCQSLMYQREIRTYLDGLNVPKEAVDAIADAYKEKAVEVMKTRPYKLINTVSFPVADAIAMKAGIKPDSKERALTGLFVAQKMCVQQTGSICVQEKDLLDAAGKLLSMTNCDVLRKALLTLYKTKTLKRQGKWVFNKEDFRVEKRTARHLVERIKEGAKDQEKVDAALERWKQKSKIELSEMQEQAVRGISHSISVITGGPGTGKSTTLKACLECYMDAFQKRNILCVAPTGKAAKRMAECTGLPAQTIHQAFGLVPADNEVGFAPQGDFDNDIDLIAIDETSMVGIHIFDHILSVLRPDTKIIILGDVYQLPSVSPGNVLYDLIACDRMQVTTLNQNYRQGEKSSIASNAERMNDGKSDLFFDQSFRFDDCKAVNLEVETENAVNVIVDEYLYGCKKYGIQNCIILSPTHYYKSNKSSILCTDKLNGLIQERINPANANQPFIKAYGKVFRVNDRVVQTKNNKDVMNGDLGTIAKIYDEDGITKVVIIFDDGRTVEYEKSDLKYVDLGYAITVHKSQGSEFAFCIMPASMTQRMMLERHLYYTGVTRAKKEFVFVGNTEAISSAAKTLAGRRKSLLSARIQVLLNK